MLKDPKAKGARAERRTIALLTATGYYCLKAGGSLGLFDVVAIGARDLRCIQVKAGGEYCSKLERAVIGALVLPAWATKEIWRWPDRARVPLIEDLTRKDPDAETAGYVSESAGGVRRLHPG